MNEWYRYNYFRRETILNSPCLYIVSRCPVDSDPHHVLFPASPSANDNLHSVSGVCPFVFADRRYVFSNRPIVASYRRDHFSVLLSLLGFVGCWLLSALPSNYCSSAVKRHRWIAQMMWMPHYPASMLMILTILQRVYSHRCLVFDDRAPDC